MIFPFLSFLLPLCPSLPFSLCPSCSSCCFLFFPSLIPSSHLSDTHICMMMRRRMMMIPWFLLVQLHFRFFISSLSLSLFSFFLFPLLYFLPFNPHTRFLSLFFSRFLSCSKTFSSYFRQQQQLSTIKWKTVGDFERWITHTYQEGSKFVAFPFLNRVGFGEGKRRGVEWC